MYSSAAHACCGLWLQIVVLAALKMRVLPKFNGCSMRHGARILASKWREGVTPNGCRPFFENGEVALPLPTSRAALVLCRAHGLLIDVSSAQRAMPIDFFRVGPFIFRVGLFIDGLETCLRRQTSATCWPNANCIGRDSWVDPTKSRHIPPKRHRLTLTLFLSETRTVLIGSSWWRVSPPPTLKDGHRQWPSGIEARLPALSPASPVSLGASFISLAIGGKLDGR